MREPDIEAMITCLRQTPFHTGYRPHHLVNDEYLTTGTHTYCDKNFISYGESTLGTITFITPEAYPHCLWEGKKIPIQEGSRVVGYAIVMKIFNELLRLQN